MKHVSKTGITFAIFYLVVIAFSFWLMYYGDILFHCRDAFLGCIVLVLGATLVIHFPLQMILPHKFLLGNTGILLLVINIVFNVIILYGVGYAVELLLHKTLAPIRKNQN